MEKLHKLMLPITILVACLILGGFYYLTERNKQASIEKQQQIEQAAKLEQSKKEYAAAQKVACLDIYTTEGKKWNNVSGWDYDEDTDKCVITYKELKPKTEAQCNKDLEDARALFKPDPVPPLALTSYIRCLDGTFTKEF